MIKSDNLKISDWLLIISLYITQYIGIGFLMVALIVIQRQSGVSLSDLSWIYLLGLPWVLKFLWAPFIDKFSIIKIGHYRSWLLILQGLMVFNLIVLGNLSFNQMPLIILFGFVFTFLSASQDIATDALVTKIFDFKERGYANGIQSAGGLLGNLIGGGGILIFYSVLNWSGSFYLMAFITAITWFQLIIFKEPLCKNEEKQSSIARNYKRIFTFWHDHYKWLLLLTLYNMGLCLVYAFFTPLLTDNGWSMSEIGIAINLVGGVVGFLSSLFAGYIISIIGRKRSLIAFIIMQIFGYFIIYFSIQNLDKSSIYLFLITYYIVYPLTATLLSTLMMDYSAKSSSIATDYSIQMSFFMLLAILFYPLSLEMATRWGYQAPVICAIVVATIATIYSLLNVDSIIKKYHN